MRSMYVVISEPVLIFWKIIYFCVNIQCCPSSNELLSEHQWEPLLAIPSKLCEKSETLNVPRQPPRPLPGNISSQSIAILYDNVDCCLLFQQFAVNSIHSNNFRLCQYYKRFNLRNIIDRCHVYTAQF